VIIANCHSSPLGGNASKDLIGKIIKPPPSPIGRERFK